jgi:hypothetical protein
MYPDGTEYHIAQVVRQVQRGRTSCGLVIWQWGRHIWSVRRAAAITAAETRQWRRYRLTVNHYPADGQGNRSLV